MGRTHALSGAVAYLAGASLVGPVSPAQCALGVVVTAGAALVPDLDHPHASAVHALGPITRGAGWVIRHVSGGHRHATHSLVGVSVATGLAWLAGLNAWATGAGLWVLAVCAIYALRPRAHVAERVATAGVAVAGIGWLMTAQTPDPWWLVGVVALGTATHVAGDMCTERGVPLAWPVSRRSVRIGSIDTGKTVERRLVVPVLYVALAALLTLPLLTG